MTAENRVYPRIDSEWPLFLERDEARKKIGQVMNIFSRESICCSRKDMRWMKTATWLL